MRLPDQFNAAANLTGLQLNDRWLVGERVTPHPVGTGGVFSINYRVAGLDGEDAFLKVVDLANAVADIDTLQFAVNEYVFERDLVLMCGEQRMSRVVTALDSGQVTLSNYALPQVNFIVFELATSDVRVALSKISAIDLIFRLQILHDVAVGLQQLHQRRVAHQDFKPSNILVLDDSARASRGKIADLGRAFRADVPSLHDIFPRPGDGAYAPPEQLYGHIYPEMQARRFAADLYQLGSLASFIFTGLTINARLSSRVLPEFHWNEYGDTYLSVLPYLEEVYFSIMDDIRRDLPLSIAPALGDMIGYLSHPNAELRGHPRNRVGFQNRVGLDRVVSQIDLMTRRAAIELSAAA